MKTDRLIQAGLFVGMALIVGALIMMFSWLISGCCIEVGPEDNGLMERNGYELEPAVLPWDVVVDPDIECIEAVTQAFHDINSWFEPALMFQVNVDGERYDELWYLDATERVGTILLTVGFTGTPEGLSDDGEPIGEQQGIAVLAYDESGSIQAADIVISSDFAYDDQTVRDVTCHEAGHTLGLEHDGSSLDLGSCMSSPPEWRCEYTPQDIGLIEARF